MKNQTSQARPVSRPVILLSPAILIVVTLLILQTNGDISLLSSYVLTITASVLSTIAIGRIIVDPLIKRNDILIEQNNEIIKLLSPYRS